MALEFLSQHSARKPERPEAPVARPHSAVHAPRPTAGIPTISQEGGFLRSELSALCGAGHAAIPVLEKRYLWLSSVVMNFVWGFKECLTLCRAAYLHEHSLSL